MSEWWTYRLSDFLLFSSKAYWRLFELHLADWWPLHVGGVLLSAAALWLPAGSRRVAEASALALLAALWAWVGWSFHLQRYAQINWAATWFGAAFIAQAALLAIAAARLARPATIGVAAAPSARVALGTLLGLIGLVVHPLLPALQRRNWSQAEIAGMAPDPTTLVTLAVLLAAGAAGPLTWAMWIVPIAWCGVSGATLWLVGAPHWWLMPAAAFAAVVVAVSRRVR